MTLDEVLRANCEAALKAPAGVREMQQANRNLRAQQWAENPYCHACESYAIEVVEGRIVRCFSCKAYSTDETVKETVVDSSDVVVAKARYMAFQPVILESPYSAKNGFTVEFNRQYGLECVRDCLLRGEAPFASHLLYTEVLDDTDFHHRGLGMQAGFSWASVCGTTVVYVDRGISGGMWDGIQSALIRGNKVLLRVLHLENIKELLAAQDELAVFRQNPGVY